MLLLRDPSPRLAQDSQGLLPSSDSPRCKVESSTPHKLLLSPFQNPINSLPVTDTATLKIEDDTTDITDTMERQNEAGGSQSRPNDHPRRLNPQQVSDAELARILQQELERAAGVDAPDSAPAPSHHRPLTLQGFGMPPVRPPQQGFPEHPFPAGPFTPIASWSAYDPQAYAEIERILRQTDPHAHGGPHEANQQSHFFPPPVAIPPTPTSSQRSPTASRRSQASSAPSGNDSPTADHTNSHRAGRPLTQAEVDAAMIAEEKRRRNTAASARFRIKKKQKVINLERSLSDLQRRADDLERETSELRRENTWLKEMVLLKGRGKVGTRRALEALVERPTAESPNRGKGKGKRRVVVVEQEEEEEDDYTSESEEEASEDEGEA